MDVMFRRKCMQITVDIRRDGQHLVYTDATNPAAVEVLLQILGVAPSKPKPPHDTDAKKAWAK